MWSTFKGTVKVLSRTPMVFVWAFAFPILLSTIFMFMFASLDEADAFNEVPVAVVADEAWDESGFSEVAETLAEPGDDQLLELHQVTDVEEGRALVQSETASGVYLIDDEGTPSLIVPSGQALGTTGRAHINASILRTVVDTYQQNAALITEIAQENPLALADADAVEAALSGESVIQQVSLTHSEPKQTVRYYYALLGMAALFTSLVAVFAICAAQPNLSALGARRCVAGTGRGRMMLGTLLASWLLSFACLTLAFCYVRFVVGVDFGGREGWCIAGLGASALFATALGTFIGALPKINEGTKVGIMTAITCLLSMFAGLYGQPCMELADQIARDFPLLASINPAKVVTDLFYSLYYYDSLVPFAEKAAVLAVMAVVLFACSMIFIRRQRYEYL